MIDTKQLDNKMLILSDSMKNSESVSINFLVKNGSRYETQDENGISHFLEHMAFKGTNTRNAKMIAEEFDMIGGHFNAYTSKTTTVYYARVLKDDWEKAWDIISDIILNSTFDKTELEKERTVILQELGMKNDSPDDVIFEYFQETAFPDQPLGRPIIGTEELINSISQEQMLDFYKRKYPVNNFILGIAGEISHNSFVQKVDQSFGGLSLQEINPYEKARYVGGEKHVYKDLEQKQFVLGVGGISYLDEDIYNLKILSIIFGGGMSSRLFQEVREKRGLVYHVSSFESSYSDSGILAVYSALKKENVNTLIDIIAEQIHDLHKEIKEEEIMRAKNQIKAGILMSMESVSSRSHKLVNNFAMYGKYITKNEILQKISQVDQSSLKLLIERIFSKNNKITFATLGAKSNTYGVDEIAEKLLF